MIPGAFGTAAGGASSQPEPRFAEVAVDVPLRRHQPGPVVGVAPWQATFHYLIPPDLRDAVGAGDLVRVPFGRRWAIGAVLALHNQSPVDAVLPLDEPLPGSPFFGPDLLALAGWLSQTYLAPLFECLRVMLPPGALAIEIDIFRRTKAPIDPRALDATELAVLGAFLGGHELTVEEARRVSKAPRTASIISALVAKGLLSGGTTWSRHRVRPKRGADLAAAAYPAHAPTADQTRALSAISAAMDATRAGRQAPQPVLLHGVTGSGKTEVYLRAIEHALDCGQSAILLVPEISLAPQTLGRVVGRFGQAVGVWHSRRPEGERRDTWERARSGELSIIVGSRSAVFAPLPGLGIVIVDEEHAESYKQGQMPRYHARDVAVARANLAGATALLGSATPAVESFWRAESGAFRLVPLPRRVTVSSGMGAAAGDGPYGSLPDVTIVDMRAELRVGNTSAFSRELAAALVNTHVGGGQSLLFLNRRGSATFSICLTCGRSVRCPRCELALTYHAPRGDLTCHHCGHREPPPMMCRQCGGPRLKRLGLGTQSVEQAAKALLPGARVIRWDADATTKRGAHEKILAQLADREADVVVGTQMLAKGIDLPSVTLVGVISADHALDLPDFRATERTFQILAQVAGRAGRSSLGGRVIIQTFRPSDPTILAAADHDYAGFYRREIAFRAARLYPPFSRLARLEFGAATDAGARRTATALTEALRVHAAELGLPETELLGPAPCFFRRIRGQFRWQLLVKSPDPALLLQDYNLGPGWRVDVDPVDLL